MEAVITILLGYAVLFYLLSREGFEVGETIHAFFEFIPWLFLGIQGVNWLFGTDFSDDAFIYVWAGLVSVWTGLVSVWTVAAVSFLVEQYWKRRQRNEMWRRTL